MLFLNGEWRLGTGTAFQSINPANGQVVWSGNAATADEVASAVISARQALPGWSRCSLEGRLSILENFAGLLETHRGRLTKLICDEVGKPLWDAGTEVQAMIGKIGLTRQALEQRRSSREINIPGGTGRTHYQSLGVVAVYGPFNFPGHIANGQIVPALLAGNCVIFKPSELTPLVAEATVKLWEEAGLPPGVLNLVQGDRETGEALSTQSGIDAILFTGSLKTGIALQKALVGRPEVLLALELGGNNPLIINRVSDIPAAVYWTIQSAFVTAGQRCTCARRLVVTEGNDEFIERLTAAAGKLQVASPDNEPQPFFGPLVSEGAAARVLTEQSRLIDSGAKPLLQARRLELGAAYLSAGVIDVTNCPEIRDEEVFGPLLQLTRVSGLEQAICAANQTQYGLVAGLFSDEQQDCELFFETVRAGLLNWNRPTTGASGLLPFGGRGRSGNHRPAGFFMIDACNEVVATMESPRLQLPEQRSPGLFV